MGQLQGMARDEGGFFSLLWRDPPKRPLRDSELSAWVCRVLAKAIAARLPVNVRYRPAAAESAETLMLVPVELYGRGSLAYLDGRVHPIGELRTFRLDRIFDARIERGGRNRPAADPEADERDRPGEPARAGRGTVIGFVVLLALGGLGVLLAW